VLPGNAAAGQWLGTFDASYQAAAPGGDTIVVPAGTYGNQVIQHRASMANLTAACTPLQTAGCVHFVMAGPVSVGTLEIRGSNLWVDGGNQLRVRGYIDTEADSAAQHPDHVIVENAASTAFGVFNADTVTFKNLDVGPQTLGTNCGAIQGSGLENKIGYAGGVVYEPRNITLDGLRIHNQNVNSAGRASDCHFGGLFIVTVQGLTIENSIFERNVVYHIQIQNFSGPKATRVVIDHNSFGCPVEWLDEKGENTCDGQAAIQFDYDPGTEFTVRNNVAAAGTGKLFDCYAVPLCQEVRNGGLRGVVANASGNEEVAAAPTAPPLLGGSPPPPPAQCADGKDNDGDGKVDLADPGCSNTSDTDETDVAAPNCPDTTLPLTKITEDAKSITFQWSPPASAEWYTFWTAPSQTGTLTRVSNGPAVLTNGTTRTTVKFGKVASGGCYQVRALGPIAVGGFKQQIHLAAW
jgi:hypothetical protein